MKIVRNDALVRRNSRIAQITMFAGLLVLAGGMFVSFQYPELFALSLGALVLGFVLSQIGIYFSNRWSRPPRPDTVLDQALKGLDNKYTLYHYSSPVSHLLVGPSGLWVFLPYRQRGTITYSKGRWRQKGSGLKILEWYMRLFAQEGLGRPDIEAAAEMENLNKFLKVKLPEDQIPPSQPVLVFTHPQVQLETQGDEPPAMEAVTAGKLKDLVRKSQKAKIVPPEQVALVEEALGSPA